MRRRGEFSRGLQKFWRRLTTTRGGPTSVSTSWPSMPAAASMLERARAFFNAEQARAPHSETAGMASAIRHFDLAGMQRAVAICCWGSSGSLLLASFLDGHGDVVMLPGHLSCAIYPFFDNYRSLSLREKLMIYPFLSNDIGDHFKGFFRGECPISGADYFAALNAAFEVYGELPAEFLESRRVFFQLLHVVYCVALGRLPTSSRPLIVYAQHELNEGLANYLVEDFPQTRFVHTVRDPITNCGRLFEHYLISTGFMAAAYVISHQTIGDAPHLNMESRTLAVRFEDMHLHLQETMRAVVDWLGLPYQPSLLESTWNGRPFVVSRGTTTWSGARPAQAVRDCRNVSFTDRCLLYAVLYENFAGWNYRCPRIFRHASVRIVTCILFLIIPLRIEILTARRIFKWQAARDVGGGLVRLCIGRAAIMTLLALTLYRRLMYGKRVLPLRNQPAVSSRVRTFESQSLL